MHALCVGVVLCICAVLQNPDIVASCNGIKTMVDSIVDPELADISGSLTLTLLYLLDQEPTRKYIRPSLDIIPMLSVFTDTGAPNSPEKEAKRAAAHKVCADTAACPGPQLFADR
jgi:hypothetical protein